MVTNTTVAPQIYAVEKPPALSQSKGTLRWEGCSHPDALGASEQPASYLEALPVHEVAFSFHLVWIAAPAFEMSLHCTHSGSLYNP